MCNKSTCGTDGTCKCGCFSKLGFKEASHPAFGLFLIRLAVASVFLFAGIMKLSNMEMAVAGFAMMGFAPFVAWLVAILETVSGLLMLFGLWTHVAGVILGIIMLSAIMFVKAGMGGGFPGFQTDLVLMLVSFGLALTGAGAYAIKCACCKGCKCDCGDCKDGKCCADKKICDNCEGCKTACSGHEGK